MRSCGSKPGIMACPLDAGLSQPKRTADDDRADRADDGDNDALQVQTEPPSMKVQRAATLAARSLERFNDDQRPRSVLSLIDSLA